MTAKTRPRSAIWRAYVNAMLAAMSGCRFNHGPFPITAAHRVDDVRVAEECADAYCKATAKPRRTSRRQRGAK